MLVFINALRYDLMVVLPVARDSAFQVSAAVEEMVLLSGHAFVVLATVCIAVTCM